MRVPYPTWIERQTLLADNKRLREIITQVQHLLGDMSGDDWRVNDALDLIDDYEQSEWQESEEE